MNDDFAQRLCSAESDFLAALKSGTAMLTSYSQTWSTLLTELSTASIAGSVCTETLSLAHSVASRISSIATCYLDVKLVEEHSSAQLRSNCDVMLHRMRTLDLNANVEPNSSLRPRDGRPGTTYLTAPLTSTFKPESSSPAFASAYHWLLENLHNPYPTAEVKTRIANASSCQVSSINSWFVNSRRRIGWTALCRKQFSNCRADMVDAAYRALVEEDPRRPLSPKLRHSFVAMKVAAEDFYSSTFLKSTLTGDIDAIINVTTQKSGESAVVRTCSQVKYAGIAKTVKDSYPSPSSSVTSSPVPALYDPLTANSEEDEAVASIVITGLKRRRPSMEFVDNQSSTANQLIKRLRTSTMSQTYLLSPPSSTDGIDESSHRSSLELSQHATPPESTMSSSQKPCPSVVDTTVPEAPHDSTAALHLQTVSDRLPHSNVENEHSIDEWFNTNFDALFTIPPPVAVTELDFCVGWEVELFKDYSIPSNPEYTVKGAPAPTATTCMVAPSDPSDFDGLLRSVDSEFVTPPTYLPQSIATGTSYAASFDSSTCDVLQTDIDWASLLNDTKIYPADSYSTSPEYPTNSQLLSDIDLSMLQLPQIIPTVDSQGDLASKQAKLQQLHSMQEAVWRIEQELRSEGVVI